MPSLCRYKDVFGAPGTGVHKHVFGIAWVDTVMTVLIAAVLSYSTGWNFLPSLLILFVLGIIMHRLFCVRTTVDKFLFG